MNTVLFTLSAWTPTGLVVSFRVRQQAAVHETNESLFKNWVNCAIELALQKNH